MSVEDNNLELTTNIYNRHEEDLIISNSEDEDEDDNIFEMGDKEKNRHSIKSIEEVNESTHYDDGIEYVNSEKFVEMNDLIIENVEYVEEGVKIPKKEFFNRMFGKVTQGSLRASIFNLSVLSIGISTLTIQSKFESLSILFCSIIIILSGIAAYTTLIFIVDAGRKGNFTQYSQIVDKYCGYEWSIFVNIFTILTQTGINIFYQVIIYRILASFCYSTIPYFNNNYDNLQIFYNNSIFNEQYFRTCFMLGTSIIILIPLNLQRNIGKLRFSTIFGLVCLIIITLVIIIQMPDYISFRKNNESLNINWYDITKSFEKSPFDFFSGFSTIIFAYSCHCGVFAVYNTLANRTKKRVKKVIKRSIFTNICFYLIIGICGYITQPVNTPNFIIARESLPNSKDVAIIICRILAALTICCKVPLNFTPLRASWFSLILKNSDVTWKRNLIFTIPYSLITCMLASISTDIGALVDFIGGFCGTSQFYLMPVVIFLKSNNNPRYHWKNILTIILFSILILIGYISAIHSLKKTIYGF